MWGYHAPRLFISSGAVVDGRIKLNKNSMPMLEDTLTILRSDEIKLASLKSRPEDTDQPADQAEQAAMAGMVIKKTIISQVSAVWFEPVYHCFLFIIFYGL